MNRHERIDIRAAGFEGLTSPDVAYSREVVGLRGMKEDAFTPARWAGGGGSSVGIWDGAVIEEGSDVWAAFTRDGFHPDPLIG